MKRLLLVMPLLLCACAPAVTRVDLPGTDQSISVPVKDLRPESEKQSESFSYLITSSGYGIYRKSDQTLDPPMVDIFRRMVFEKLGNPDKSMDISIYHMVVYKNLKSELRTGAIGGALGGAIGGAIAAGAASTSSVNISQSLVDRSQFEAGGGEEYERAFYTDTENPDHASVYVIYIDAAVNGKRVFVKTMAPTKAPKEQNAYGLAVKSAIQYYLSQYSKA